MVYFLAAMKLSPGSGSASDPDPGGIFMRIRADPELGWLRNNFLKILRNTKFRRNYF